MPGKKPSRDQLVGAALDIRYEVWMLLKLSDLILALPPHRQSEEAVEEAESQAYTHTTYAEVSLRGSPGPPLPPENLVVFHNAIIESFTIHARALIDFLYRVPNTRHTDDIFAEHFFDEPATWISSRPQLSRVEVARIKNRVGKEIAHLTYKRQMVDPVDKPWPISEIVETIYAAWRTFLELAPRDLVGPDLARHDD